MSSNAREQHSLQYMSGREAKKYLAQNSSGWDAEHKHFMVGNRSRSLQEYSDMGFSSKNQRTNICRNEFEGIQTNGLFFLFDYFLAQKGKVVWVDLGSGNAIAQRQARRWFARTGRGSDNLVTVGYDVLPFDKTEYHYRKAQAEKAWTGNAQPLYEKDDLDPSYNPILLTEDITDVVFPIPPDIVSCFQVLQWTTNPLEIFANAASQMPEGSVFSILGLPEIYSTQTNGYTETEDYLFRKISKTHGRIPGFTHIYATDDLFPAPREPEIFVRTDEQIPDFTFGFRHAKWEHPWDEWNDRYSRTFRNYYQEERSI